MMLPPTHTARCTHTGCSWRVETPEAAYRDTLAAQHTTRYAHTTHALDLN